VWRSNTGSTQTKGWLKYKVIARAGELFGMTPADIEKLANKAGLSMQHLLENKNIGLMNLSFQNDEFSTEIFPYDAVSKSKPTTKHESIVSEAPQYTAFMQHLEDLISSYPGKKKEIYEAALVSERMFRYIRSGINVKKEPTLALLIAMRQPLDSIQKCLAKAGFILSKSIVSDVVIMQALEDEAHINSIANMVYRVNTTLDSLDLPLLMTGNIKSI